MPQLSPLRSFMLCLAPHSRCLVLGSVLLTLAGCQSTNNQTDNDNDRALGMGTQQGWNSTLEEPLRRGADAHDIWERIRNGYKLQHHIRNNPRVDQQRFGFASRPDSVQQIAERSSPYIHYIVERLENSDFPLELALLPMIESSYNPLAYSPAQAAGLWQFIPSTGRTFNLRQTTWYDGRRDITASTNAAVLYLQRLHDMFNGDWLLALAAYNAGEGTVSRAIERNARQGLPTDYWNLPLPRETQDYVPKLLALSQIIQAPASYGINLTPIANRPYFEKVTLRHQLDLAKVANLADMDEKELFQLNPAFKQRVTMDGPQHVLVPVEKADELSANLARLPNNVQPQWQHYQVRSVDSLNSIANRFRVATSTLRELNNLRGNRLKVGQELIIPPGAGNSTMPLYTRESEPTPTPVAKGKGAAKNNAKNAVLLTKSNKTIQKDKNGKPLKSNTKESARPTAVNNTQKNSKSAQYTARNGDTIWTISRAHNVPVKDLQKLNPKLGTQIKPGQAVTLPSSAKR